jgi:hypothetical protein
MKGHAKNCPCAPCMLSNVERAERILTRCAVVLWAIIFAIVVYLVGVIQDLPPQPNTEIEASE